MFSAMILRRSEKLRWSLWKYIVDEWHNAYRPNGETGIALVIEKTDIKTEYGEINR